MGSFLSNESSFGRLMTKCGTFVIVNLLFAICCIPFFTVGAAASAMYSALFALLSAEEEDRLSHSGAEINPLREFLSGLRRTGLRAFLLWTGWAALMGLGVMNLQICAQWAGPGQTFAAGVSAIMVLASLMMIFLLPVMASPYGRELPLKELFSLTARTALARPLRSGLIILLQVIPLALIGLDEVNRPTYGFIGSFFGFAIIAYISARLLLPQLRAASFVDESAETVAGREGISLLRRLKDRQAEKYLM